MSTCDINPQSDKYCSVHLSKYLVGNMTLAVTMTTSRSQVSQVNLFCPWICSSSVLILGWAVNF
jgi:hypothetical protein